MFVKGVPVLIYYLDPTGYWNLELDLPVLRLGVRSQRRNWSAN